MPNMIFYLINDYHMEVTSGSIILSLWSASSNALGVFGALLSDSYMDRFWVIILGSVSSFFRHHLLCNVRLYYFNLQRCQVPDHFVGLPFIVRYFILLGSQTKVQHRMKGSKICTWGPLTNWLISLEPIQNARACKNWKGEKRSILAKRIGFLIQRAADEAVIKQLKGDITVHKNHLESVTKRLKRVRYDDESRYQHEIQDLKDCLSIEQEEKNELNKKLLILEKELLISRNKLSEHQRDLTSNHHVEALRQKIMKLRKENEVLKRNLQDSKEG